jgi:DNA helicase-2/ATP-dependent DNA helicase PcrA
MAVRSLPFWRTPRWRPASTRPAKGEEAVQLMTVHAAKGLEFDVVFITGLEQGLFPHENAAQERDGLEEERRLMYVAVTRARHRLYLSHAQTRLLHGQTRYCLPSAFLDELPATLLRKINRGERPSRHAGRERWRAGTSRQPAVCGSARTCAMPGSVSGSSCPPKGRGRKHAYRSISVPAA